jgi:hypothetical protein
MTATDVPTPPADYATNQMTYDLRSPRPQGLIDRLPGTHTHQLTHGGIRVAVFYTKLHSRLLEPLMRPDRFMSPIELRRAFATIDRVIEDYVDDARIGRAA